MMLMRFATKAVIALVFALGVGSGCSKLEPATITSAEQDVVEAILADNAESPTPGKRGLYSKSSTGLFWPGERHEYSVFIEELRRAARYQDRVFQDLVDSYARANEADTKLVFPRKLPDNIVLVPPGKDVRAAKDRFPGIEGVYEISRVAIDDQRTTALVSLIYYREVNSAYGRFYILKFDGKKWVVQKSEGFGPIVMT